MVLFGRGMVDEHLIVVLHQIWAVGITQYLPGEMVLIGKYVGITP